jgi:hypothetical protein
LEDLYAKGLLHGPFDTLAEAEADCNKALAPMNPSPLQ